MTPADQIAHLDRFLDALARGNGADGVGLDPDLVATVRRVGERAPTSAPDPAFAARLWAELALPAASPAAPGANGRTPSPIANPAAGVPARGWAARSSRPLAELATAAVLILALLGSLVAFRPWGAAPTGQVALDYDLYVSDRFSDAAAPQRFVPLDPATLADRTGGTVFDLGGDESRDWAISPDGSTLVGIEYRYTSGPGMVEQPEDVPDDAVTIVVRDGRTGAERVRFHPSAYVVNPMLSRDGGRLVVEAIAIDRDPRAGPPGWHVYDTRDGRLLSSVGYLRSPRGTWVDAAAGRLYQLVEGPAPSGDPAPRAAEVIAYDLIAGVEVGRLKLTVVAIGSWETDRTVEGAPVFDQLAPGGALSPDGRTLAIVHADAERVTVVDIERLVVDRTVGLRRPTSLRDRLLALLPLMPRGAEAKGPFVGTIRRAVFAPDGRHLYVSGFEAAIADDGRASQRGLGLMRVDLEDGEVVAEGLGGSQLDLVLPSPDGESVYVFGPGEPYGMFDIGPEPKLLRRLDAFTLGTLAEREFHGWSIFLLKPTAGS